MCVGEWEGEDEKCFTETVFEEDEERKYFKKIKCFKKNCLQTLITLLALVSEFKELFEALEASSPFNKEKY